MGRVGPFVGVGRRRRRNSLTDADAIAYVAAMSVAPSPAVQAAIQTFITAAKAAGVWSKLALGYLLNLHAEQASRLNIVAPASFALTDVGSAPTWASGVGGAGGFSAQLLTTGWDVATNGGALLSQNNAGFTLRSRTSGLNTSFDFGETSLFCCACRTTGDVTTGRLHRGTTFTSSSPAITDGSGIYSMNRSGSTAGDVTVRKDKGAVTIGTGASTGASAADLYICGANGAAVGSRRLSSVFVHSALNATEADALADAISVFDTAIGAS